MPFIVNYIGRVHGFLFYEYTTIAIRAYLQTTNVFGIPVF